jgi:hypothetical protein
MANWGAKDVAAARRKVNRLVERLPEVVIEDSHGHTGYKLRGRRILWLVVDHHGDGRLAIWVKAPKDEQEALVGGDPGRYFVPPYVGPSGWVGVHLDPASKPDWDEIDALLEQAWRMSATKRAIAAFDS